VILLFLFVLGGIYGGLFTVEEGAGVGAAGTLLIGVLRRPPEGARRSGRADRHAAGVVAPS
jgi:TRAP-type C4-dicarboxylate transport system permease large subunit